MPSKATRLDFLRGGGGGQVWLGRNEIIDGRGSSANRVRSESFDYIGIFTRKATMERGTGEESVEAQL